MKRLAARFRFAIIAFVLSAALSGPGCSGDGQRQVTPPPPASFFEDLATSVVVEMGMSAWEKGCQDGNTIDCKILFSKEHDGYDDTAVQKKLDDMNVKLDTITKDMGQIQEKIDNLAALLKVTAEDLKVDSKQNFLTQYEIPVRSAYDAFRKADFRSSTPDQVANFCREVMTFPLNSQYQYNVPQNLEMIHGNLIDESGGGNGLFDKLDNFLAAKWTSPVAASDAVNTYDFLEKSFGFVLGDQAKGAAVIAACYQYYEKHPEAMKDIHLDEATLDEYMTKKYRPNIEAQVQRFLASVEKFVALAADVNKAGDDASWSWVGDVLLRADLMATWVRISAGIVPANAPSPLQYPFRQLVVRVVGEPDRVGLFYSRSLDGGMLFKGDGIPVDPDSVGDKAITRKWPVHPYLQFPVHLDLPAGDLKRMGAVKGAKTLDMLRYAYTKADYSMPQAGSAVIDLNSNNSKLRAWLADVPVEVRAYGPNGAVIQDTSKLDPHAYIVIGHVTIVLKETARRVGVWSQAAVSSCSAYGVDNADRLSATGQGFFNSSPRYIQETMFAMPYNLDEHRCDYGGCYDLLIGNACQSVGLSAQYYFEGWGDVSPVNSRIVFDGSVTQSVEKSAAHGEYYLQVRFAQTGPSAKEEVATVSQDGPAGATVSPGVAWKAKDVVTLRVLTEMGCDWSKEQQGAWSDKAREAAAFQASMRYELDGLTMKLQ